MTNHLQMSVKHDHVILLDSKYHKKATSTKCVLVSTKSKTYLLPLLPAFKIIFPIANSKGKFTVEHINITV